MPPGAKPLPLPNSAPNGPSMLQSCGTFNCRQPRSSNAGIIADAKSPWLKSQFASKSCVTRASAAAAETGAGENRIVTVAAAKIAAREIMV